MWTWVGLGIVIGGAVLALWFWLDDRRGFDLDELARRLDVTPEDLANVPIAYRSVTIPKRRGGERHLLVPDPELRALQRRILRRLLGRLRSHPCATGFEPGVSIVHNAAAHAGQAVIVKIDVVEFFANTTSRRIRRYFHRIGWNGTASRRLTALVTWNNGLPMGAPTSPRLSNLVNFIIDARLEGLARRTNSIYTRYADDITFSLAVDDAKTAARLVRFTRDVLLRYGYAVHRRRKKPKIVRRYRRQLVTGLVVNDRVNLPRETRRRLRAIDHARRTGRPVTMTEEERAGWAAFEAMIERQRDVIS